MPQPETSLIKQFVTRLAQPSADRIRNAFVVAADALCYCGAFILLMLIWRWLRLPQGSELFEAVTNAFRSYGFAFVGIAALIEGLLVVNLYFPGSLVILIGVTAFRGSPLMVVMLVATVIAAFFLATIINYCIGYYGLHALISRLKADTQIQVVSEWHRKVGRWFVPLSFFHPNLSAFVAVACGRDRISPYRFFPIALIATIAWNSFWGGLTYSFGPLLKEAVAKPWLILGGLLLWAMLKMIRGFFGYRKRSS